MELAIEVGAGPAEGAVAGPACATTGGGVVAATCGCGDVAAPSKDPRSGVVAS